MLRSPATLLLAALFAAPSLAQDARPTFGGFAEAVAMGRFAQSDAATAELTTPIVAAVGVGQLTVQLEATTIAEIASALGGTIVEASDGAVWICYGASDDRTLWFHSDDETGDGRVSLVALEAVAPQPSWSCHDAPSLEAIDLGVPAIGTSTIAVTGRHGAPLPDEEGRFGFTSLSPHPSQSNVTIRQDIVFRTSDGVINATAVRQETGSE